MCIVLCVSWYLSCLWVISIYRFLFLTYFGFNFCFKHFFQICFPKFCFWDFVDFILQLFSNDFISNFLDSLNFFFLRFSFHQSFKYFVFKFVSSKRIGLCTNRKSKILHRFWKTFYIDSAIDVDTSDVESS